MEFMAWLQQEDTDLTYLQVDSSELPKQETGRTIQIPSSSDLRIIFPWDAGVMEWWNFPESQVLKLVHPESPALVAKCHEI